MGGVNRRPRRVVGGGGGRREAAGSGSAGAALALVAGWLRSRYRQALTTSRMTCVWFQGVEGEVGGRVAAAACVRRQACASCRRHTCLTTPAS